MGLVPGSRDAASSTAGKALPLGVCVLEGCAVINKYTSGCYRFPEDKVRVERAEWIFSHKAKRGHRGSRDLEGA